MFNQQAIKSGNLKRIYRLISENPGVSRVKLSKMMGVSKTTASNLVDELIQMDFVIDQGTGDSKKTGRKPNELNVNEEDNSIIVVSFRKDGMTTAVVSSGYRIRQTKEIGPGDSLSLSNALITLINHVLADEKKNRQSNILGICIVIPGIIDGDNKCITSTVLSLTNDSDMIRSLEENFKDYPMAIFNDTSCLAYAESEFGKMAGKNSVYINMNEGVGAALIRNGGIFRGATGLGMQFGHVSIDPDGIQCECGNRGCLEKYIGELALRDRVIQCGAQEIFPKGRILYRDVGMLAAAGEGPAIEVLRRLSLDLGQALRNMIVMFHPDEIIIGGVGVKLGEKFLSEVRERVAAQGFRRFIEDVKIDFTSLEEDVIFRGAAKYYMDTHYDFMSDMEDKLFFA